MIKSITAAQKISISINIYTNKYYPGAPREQERQSNITTSLSLRLLYPFHWRSEEREERSPVASSSAGWRRSLINLAAGAGQTWTSSEQEFEYSQKVKTTQNILFLFWFLLG